MEIKNKSASSEEECLCPICGRVLQDSSFSNGGWSCKCGEFVPKGLHAYPRMRPAKGKFFAAELESAIRQGPAAPRRSQE